MLDKHDSTSLVQNLDSKKKSAPSRCNLKKLLDPTRFSPRSLRLSRLTKLSESSTTDDPIHTSKVTKCPDDNSSLIQADQSKVLDGTYPKMLYTTSDGKTTERIVEEEYEESLSHFADLILDGPKPQQSDSVNNPLVHSMHRNRSAVRDFAPSSELSPSPSYLPTPTSFATAATHTAGDPTPLADFATNNNNNNKFLRSSGSCDQSIYNEPCDAKSVAYIGSIETAAIYTSPGFQYSSSGTPFALNGSSVSSFSSTSATDSAVVRDNPKPTDTRDNPAHFPPTPHSTSTRKSTTDMEPGTGDLDEKSDAIRPQDSSTGGNHPQRSSQLNPGFVDAPRGNSVIVHHSTSAFARVPPSVSPDQISYVANNHGHASRHTPPQSAGRLQPRGPTHDNGTHSGSRGQADAHATYEEAWDLKMTRQLGFGIPRLPLPQSTSPRVPDPRPAVLPRAELLDRLASNERLSPPDQRLQRGSSVRSGSKDPTQWVSNSPNGDTSQLLNNSNNNDVAMCHENSGLVDNRTTTTTTTGNHIRGGRNKTIEPPDPSVEYDYAYNGSWSLGVQLNMKLAINENNGSCPAPCTAKPPGAPQVTTMYHTNHSGQKRSKSTNPRLATGHCFDTDTLSADSFGDSWDTRHNKIISDLTRSRFVDASSVLPTTPQATTLHCTPLQLRPLPEPITIATTTTTTTAATTTPLHQPTMPIDGSKLMSKNPQKRNKLSPRLEVLPLEDQPWFHPSLTRSEAEELLAAEPEGTFLVRNSETCLNDYSLTIKHKIFVHMKISRNSTGQYILGDYSQPYASVPQMIYHYARTLVPVRGADYVTLKHPFCR